MKKKRTLSDSRNPDIQTWTVSVEEDPETGDLILPLPEDLLELQGWQTGDTLTWDQREDGAWQLSKKETEMKTKDGKDRFDLEQEIMQCWNVTEDLRVLGTRHPQIAEDLNAIAHVYEMRFDHMFNTFSQLIKDGIIN